MRFRGKRIGGREIAIVIAIALGLWLVIGFFVAGFVPVPAPPGLQPIILKGGHVQGSKIATKSWSFQYTSAELSPDGTTGTIEGISNGVVLRKGKPYARVSAASINLNTQTLDFTAIGKVHIERINDPEKRSFDTDNAIWNNGIEELTMPHPSYFHTEHATLKVKNITINFKTGKVILGGLTGKILLAH